MIHQGTILHGFETIRIRYSDELGGTMYEMIHLATGAKLCWLDNGALNKLFAIGFTSLPCDDTGVFHILEHSVLCGSEKYPVKEPFVELKKNSLHTFLNAMTAPDKTIYPISSRNGQDYLNLVSVYLDAVFAPRLLTEKNIFLQEGWHLEENDGVLSCKGVVYNEMKGALSDETSLMNRRFAALLFPDSIYRHNSGGTPAAIRRLTYEQFIDSYKKTYHPSNSFVYLDGSVPIEATLEKLNEYFTRYERLTELPVFTMQTPVCARAEQPFELKAGESPENKSSLCLGKIIGTWRDRVKVQAVDVLSDVLCASNESPLRKAVIDSGLAVNLSFNVRSDGLQPYAMIYVKHVKDGQDEAVQTLIRETVRELIERGLDRELLEAVINRMEFTCREMSEPQALYRMFGMSNYPLGGDPLDMLCWNEVLSALRAMIGTGEYEALLREIFLSEDGLSVLKMVPSATLGEELRREEEADLRALWDGMTEAERAANRAQNEALLLWQQTPDTAENLSKVPLLPLSAVSDEPEWTDTTMQAQDGAQVLFHRVSSGNIVYANAYFALSDFELDDLSALSLTVKLLGKLPTRRRSAQEIDRLIQAHTGKISFSLLAYPVRNRPDLCRPMLCARFSALKEHFAQASALIGEILTETLFDDSEKVRLITRQIEIGLQRMSVLSGQTLGAVYALSSFSAAGAVNESVSGLTFSHWVKTFLADFDGKFDVLRTLSERLQADSLCRSRLTVSIGAPDLPDVSALLSCFGAGSAVSPERRCTLTTAHRTGVAVPARISYAVQGYHLSRSGIPYHGSMKVGGKLLSLDYLWNKVRVQGGAYGARFALSQDGELYAYSYRDPSPHATLETYRRAADHIRALCAQGVSLDCYILSAASEDDPLLSPRQACERADLFHFVGYTKEDARRNRREILDTTMDDMLAFCALLSDFAEHGHVCVIGHKGALEKCADLEEVRL